MWKGNNTELIKCLLNSSKEQVAVLATEGLESWKRRVPALEALMVWSVCTQRAVHKAGVKERHCGNFVPSIPATV